MKKILLEIRRRTDKYISSAAILAFDVILSVLSSFCTFLLIYWLAQWKYFPMAFTIWWMFASLIISFACFYVARTYSVIIRHFSLRDMPRFIICVIARFIFIEALIIPIFHNESATYSRLIIIGFIDMILLLCMLVGARSLMVYLYDIVKTSTERDSRRTKTFVYGTSDKSVAFITRLQFSPQYNIVGFISYGGPMKKYSLADRPILHFQTVEDIAKLKQQYNVEAIIFPREHNVRDEKERLIPFAMECGIKVLLSPAVDEIVDGKINHNEIRQIRIEDLLGRPEIQISMDQISSNFNNKVILVTGAAGSIGSELCRQLASMGVKKLILFDNGETPMHNLRLELDEKYPELDYVPIIGDVRSKPRLDYVFRNFSPQIVFHAAAYKHVPLMEDNPCEAVMVNVCGSHYVANKCIEYGAEKMVMISTDKAVNPTNIMGCTKRIAEIYVQSLGLAVAAGQHRGITKFVTTRFGNVLGSNGSVIPRFREQIEKGGPVTVTHPEIIRFFMTIPEACRLVMEAATMSKGNEIFVFDMGQPVKIVDMARRMIELAGYVPDKDIKITFTGLRAGEKLYEEVLANSENTIPTNHQRIKIAKVREYDYQEVHQVVNKLVYLSAQVQIPEMVALMKKTVPEFKTTNVNFQKY
ncbi:MAG: polysaccharide biosynthesis protein [Bacteroidaceae bacterium]|nr:polysaccharide biosynthesis protein [Bacteroidaceae bacterium]